MAITVAFSGKGGTGKTTLSGFLVRYLIEHKKTPILVVDADPNHNLNEVLGVEVDITLGEIREQMKKGDVPTGMTKDRFIETKMAEAIIEADDFDLIVMGRPEGPGCYCAANALLSEFLRKLVKNYEYIVMDNEAGMEHISRLTTSDVDIMIIVSDASKRGLQAAFRINELAKNLGIVRGDSYLIINNVPKEPSEEVIKYIKDQGLNYAGVVRSDEMVQEYDLSGRPTFSISKESMALLDAYKIFNNIIV